MLRYAFTQLSRLSSIFLLILVFSLMGCQQNQEVAITFAFGPDESGTIQALIDEFNKANAGKIKVDWQVANRLSNEYYKELETELQKEDAVIHVFGSDVVWTGAFASKSWVEDLSSRFYEGYKASEFLDACMNSAIYDFQLYGVPWYTDVGMLIYRKDLLEASGFDHPPATWQELVNMSKKVMADSGTKYGFIFQGADYEGGVVNACEFIWNAGSDILLGDLSVSESFDEGDEETLITVNNKDAISGLAFARKLIDDGISPQQVTSYQERETYESFANGEAVFMRAWPTVYYLFAEEDSEVEIGDLGFAPLPVAKAGNHSYSCLGGWNLMINAQSTAEEKDAAWSFILYLINPLSQRYRAEKNGVLPSVRSLYDDQGLLNQVAVMALAKNIIRNTRERPRSPNYMQMSPAISNVFHAILQGEVTPDEGAKNLENNLKEIVSN